jgi:hypothetical protein
MMASLSLNGASTDGSGLASARHPRHPLTKVIKREEETIRKQPKPAA